MKLFASVALLCACMAATPAWAGIADSPLPSLGAGEPVLHLYSVPGAIKYVGLETAVSCTSTDSVPVIVGVEFFAGTGGAALNSISGGDGRVTIPAGGTMIIASGGVTGIFADHTLNVLPNFNGSARIVASSKKVICTAMLISASGSPPTSMTYLTIVKKTKQKAGN